MSDQTPGEDPRGTAVSLEEVVQALMDDPAAKVYWEKAVATAAATKERSRANALQQELNALRAALPKADPDDYEHDRPRDPDS